MQANAVKVENFDGLFALFTSLEPRTIRNAVLQTIADPSVEIGTRNWDDCLFARAATVAMRIRGEKRRFLLRETFVEQTVAPELGISTDLVVEGIHVWDEGSTADRDAFRGRIRIYLQEQGQAPVPVSPLPQSTARRLMANVRELVGAK